MRKPSSNPPRQFTPSFSGLGIIAEAGCLIELRAPEPGSRGDWPRLYLTPYAAEKLLEWLPDAIAMQSEAGPNAA